MNSVLGPIEFGKGSATTPIVVTQSGGPVAQPGGKGALVELEDEDLMLPGDEVLVLLVHAESGSGYAPVYGAGVQRVSAGKMSGHSAELYGVDGFNFATVWTAIVDPNVSATAFPLRAQTD